MVIMTVINVIALLCIIFLAVMMYMMMNSFGELIVKFIEQNQEYYKSQKHLTAKSNELAISLKKIPNLISNLKKASIRIDTSIAKKDKNA